MTRLTGVLRASPRGRPPGRPSTIGAQDRPSVPTPRPVRPGSCFTRDLADPTRRRAASSVLVHLGP